MKGTITVIGNEIKLALDPETEVERLVFRELGDDMSISRCHHSIVLRRRGVGLKRLGRASVACLAGSRKIGSSITMNLPAYRPA